MDTRQRERDEEMGCTHASMQLGRQKIPLKILQMILFVRGFVVARAWASGD